MTITINTYKTLQEAYDFFNKEIFDTKLPECLITLVPHRAAYGYFRNQAFNNDKKKATDEISLNPFTFHKRTDRQIFSTLVHEMVHLWQHRFGEPKKTAHDKQWANKMEEVGLMPSSTGAPGGKRTGNRVSHYIIDDGLFDQVEKKFKGKIEWRGHMHTKPKKPRKRTKYTCPDCNTNVYGKADLSIRCEDCDTLFLA